MLENLNDYVSVLIPKPCPYPLIRIGGVGDGAYLVPDDLQGITACFSPGVNNIKSFEDQLSREHNIVCHMCDYSCDESGFLTPLLKGMQTFKKKWLDSETIDDSISLDDWVEELAPNPQDDLILQMDIEGAEWRNLDALTDKTLCRFRIIVIELHDVLNNLLRPYSGFSEDARVLERLDQHFVCVYARPNNCCGEGFIDGLAINVPQLLELTFLRRDRLSTFDSSFMQTNTFPHPLDIGRNVPDKPPLFLNEAWSGGLIGEDARVRMQKEELDFFRNNYGGLVSARTEFVELIESWKLEYAKSLDDIIDKDLGKGTNVAFGKPYSLSSAYSGFSKTGFVEFREPFLFHTELGANQHIIIDLLEQWLIRCVTVRNRTDGARERARFLLASISQTAEEGSWRTFPLSITSEFLEDAAPLCSTRTPHLIARYVKIFSPTRTYLHLSDVNIFANPISGS